MRSKTVISVVGGLFAVAIMTFAYFECNKNSMDDLFYANVEALSNEEIVTIPCKRAVSVCEYVVKDVDGVSYMAQTSGMRNAE